MGNDLIQVVNQPTSKGYELLNSIVTNTSGNVYGFWPYVPADTIAAAMARLASEQATVKKLKELTDKQ